MSNTNPHSNQNHNVDEDGWCKNQGCDWNVWNAKSSPDCPVNFGGRHARTVQEQEDMLAAKLAAPQPANTLPSTPIESDAWISRILLSFVDPYVASLPEGKKALADAKAAIQAQLDEAVAYEKAVADNCRMIADADLPGTWLEPVSNKKLYNQAAVDEAVASTIGAAAKACNVSEYWLEFQLTTQSKQEENK